jgi:hypothetical protein
MSGKDMILEDAVYTDSLLNTLRAFKRGDFSVRMRARRSGVAGEIAAALNEIIEQNERLLKATTEIDEEVSGDRLQSQFRQLERGAASTTVDARLLELKQKMGVLPPGSAQSNRQLGAGQAGSRSGGEEEQVAAELEDSSEEKSGS